MSQEELKNALPAAHQKILEASTAKPARMMAAKGMAPLAPRDNVIAMCGLVLDWDEELADTARSSLAAMPDGLLLGALESGLPAPALFVLAGCMSGRDLVIEKLLVNRDTPDDAIAALAATANEAQAEIIANNQERCLRSNSIVSSLRQNANLLRSSRDRLFDFLVRAGVVYEDMPEYAEAMTRLSSVDLEASVSKIVVPIELNALLQEPPDGEGKAEEIAKALEEGGAEVEQQKRVPLMKLVASLSVAQRVALAIKGNKEARVLMLRDTNRVVASAAIRNPRITEQEVVTAAQSRSVSDEVIRIIAGNKEHVRSYKVKMALASNPKTPLPTAIQFLSLLRESDVAIVAKSKNVPSAVAAQARRMMQKKK